MNWTKVFLATIGATIIFFLLAQSRLGLALETTAFAFLFFSVFVALETAAMKKEGFFFEVTPHKKCDRGFYGLPIQYGTDDPRIAFDYSIPECGQTCNPF